jgi:sugar diacid utilization regulator
MLESIGEEKLITYCYLPLLELLRKASHENRELLLTLYAYTVCLGRATAAAKLLRIHYNTLKQRLNLIEAAIGDEFKHILPAVYISILIIRLLRLVLRKNAFLMY